MANGRLTWLPAALRNAGLAVDTVAGWETRGQPQMHPKVLVLHHTAGPKGRNAPSLNVCINGRSDLPGPLCHILIGRDGTCHVIASGRAHHAGVGQWKGVTGNSNAIGIEVENVGTKAEPWTDDLIDVMVRASRACIDEAGIPVSMVCGHKEWAPKRKVDPHSLSMNHIRALIATAGPKPQPPPEDDDMDPRALVVLTYNAVLGRNPESLTVIKNGVKSIVSHPGGEREGQNAYVAAIANSPEAKKRHASR